MPQKLIIELLFDNEFKKIAGQLIWRTGVNDNVLKQMLKAYSQGILKTRDFIILRYPQDTKNLNQALVEEALSALLVSDEEGSLFTVLEIADSFYTDKDVIRRIPKDPVFELLTKPDFFTDRLDTMQEYHWDKLAKRYLDAYPERDLEFFRLIMTPLKNWRFMILKSTSSFHSIAEQITKGKPAETWEIIQNLLGCLNTDLAYGLLHWLEEERDFGEEHGICPLTYFPANMVLAWVDADPDNRSPAIARVAPKTLDKEGNGWITPELLHRFGQFDRVKSALFSNYHTDGWSVPASEHYRKNEIKRDRGSKERHHNMSLNGWKST